MKVVEGAYYNHKIDNYLFPKMLTPLKVLKYRKTKIEEKVSVLCKNGVKNTIKYPRSSNFVICNTFLDEFILNLYETLKELK